MSTFRLSLVSSFAVLLVSSGCHRIPQQTAEAESLHASDGRRVISADVIERSGARTAWEALQRTVPFFTFNDNNRGGTSRIEHRGRSSIVLRDQPIILIDGVELNDFGSLTSMPASDIADIEVLSGIDATTYYGTGASKGVIRIRTRSGG